MKNTYLIAALSLATLPLAAQLTVSPTSKGALPATVSPVGGIVIDLVGLNGSRVVAQAAASSLFIGSAPGSNPSPLIGSLGGFDGSVTGALGGGLAEAAFRFTLYDGDTAPGNFDDGDTTLDVNGVNFGNWSAVTAYNTTGLGSLVGGTGNPQLGFANNTLDSGWFYNNTAGDLATLFTSMVSTEVLNFGTIDIDPGDQFYDFTQGIDQTLIDVGSGPVITPPTNGAIPEPSAVGLLGFLLVTGTICLRRRR